MAAVLTIGMPVYNGAATIRNALDSLLAQTLDAFELVISDNGSTDDTQAICEEYVARDSRVRYFRQPTNLGPQMNFRFVLFEARTPYFMWAAADDLWKPRFAEKNVAELDKDQSIVMSQSRVLFLQDGKPSHVATGTYALMDSWAENAARFFQNPADNSRYYGVFRTAALQAVFPPRPFYALDWGVSGATLKYGKHFEIPDVLMMRDSSDDAAYANAVSKDHRFILWRIFPLLYMTRWLYRNGYAPATRAVAYSLLKLNLYIHFRFGLYKLDGVAERYLAANSLRQALGLSNKSLGLGPGLGGRLSAGFARRARAVWRALPLTIRQRQFVKAGTYRMLGRRAEKLKIFEEWGPPVNDEFVPSVPERGISKTGVSALDIRQGEPRISVAIIVDTGPADCIRALAAAERMAAEIPLQIVVAGPADIDVASLDLAPNAIFVPVEGPAAAGALLSAAAGAVTAPLILMASSAAWYEPGLWAELEEALAKAPIVAPQILYADGRLAAAGGVVPERSAIWKYGRFGQPQHPLHSFARVCDFAPFAVALRREALVDGPSFDPAYRNFDVAVADFCLKARTTIGTTLYWPLARIARPHAVMRDDGLDELTPDHWMEDWVSLHQSHRTLLQQDAALEDQGRAQHNRTRSRRMLYIDADTPTPDQNAGSIEAFNLMQIFGDFGFQVTFVPESNFIRRGRYTDALQKIGVEAIHHPYQSSIAGILAADGPQFDVVVLCRAYIAERYLDLVRELAPQAKIIFNTIDLHFLREERKAELSGNEADIEQAARSKESELKSINGADLAIVLSTFERDVLQREAPDAQVHVLPLVRDVPASLDVPGPTARRDIVFIGTYQHPPNEDAVLTFVNDVWPLVRQRLPDTRFLIIGSAVTPAVQALAGDGVEVLGFVQDLNPILDGARLSVAPLRYGAGLKGKLATTLQRGLPTVATRIAAEGMDLVDGHEVLIAEAPQAMADAIVRLHTEDELWQTISRNGFDFVRREFSLEANIGRIAVILDAVGMPVSANPAGKSVATDSREEAGRGRVETL